MPRQITPRTTLENLKREAKRWLATLRANAGDAAAEARTRLRRAFPDAPDSPTLRHIQHALALEHGLDGWRSLTRRLAARGGGGDNAGDDEAARAYRVAWFLESACPDHHVRGGSAHVRARFTAMRALERYPEIAHENFYTAVVCGDLGEVEAVLARRPAAAREPNQAPVPGPDRSASGNADDLFKHFGPKQWEPLLFLCFTRLPLAAANDNAVAIARALLDLGADSNAFFMAGSSRYTPLVGVIGEGEEDRPPHPHRDELARLLLERGAEPYDIQVLYNIHFHGDALWFLELVHEFSLKLGRPADWDDPDWTMLGMGGYGPGAYYVLHMAVRNDNVALARWVLEHGGNPNLPTSYSHPKFRPTMSLHELAVRGGRTEIAELLVQHGATPSVVTLSDAERLTAAALRLDRAAVAALIAAHPELLRSTLAMFTAAEQNRADAVAVLLDAGVSPDIENDAHQRPLHMAAYSDAARAAALLIERGAAIDPVETSWGGTPLGGASYSQSRAVIDLLAPLSRDVWELTHLGRVDRLREIFAAEPARARVVTSDGQTPLMWLPYDDEQRAIDVAGLYLANGADPSLKNTDGQTAADRAERLGMFRLAAMLRAGGRATPPSAAGPLTLRDYDERASALLDAYRTGTPEAMERHWRLTWHRRTWSAMRSYTQLDLGRHADDANRDADISLDDARFLIAREHGFDGWQALSEYIAHPSSSGHVTSKPIALLSVDEMHAARPTEWERSWDSAIAMMRDRRLAGLDAHGQMTDAMLADIAGLEHITVLKLGGSAGVTDAGLSELRRLPRLRHLDVSGCAITDRGLDVLRELPELETVEMAWTRVTDAGVANLKDCHRLEIVNLQGSASGDGALAAMAGKVRLRTLRTGNYVTDAGLPLLHDIPAFKTWQGGDPMMSLLSYDSGPNHLFIRGPFTDAGLATLAGLDGLFALNADDAALAITPAGLAPLVTLPNLGWLSVDATDQSMPYIAAMPRLRFLGCQDTVAGDDGFVALSKSRSIEHIWGRRCHNLRARGFKALSRMPALRALSVSCKNVDDEGVATLPLFPALRELMPMDIPDEGYRHIGRCENMESLVLMYCRDTGDRATEHIAGLSNLKKYFVSYNKITDRSLEILSTMNSLEHIELSAIAGVTNAGVATLARLPRLRELRLSGNQLTRPEPGVFPARVDVAYEL